ncbi:uncharacterized protein LOC131410567 isoform X3 [Diceros bicornis minor]|uniref:uncharacterized protein LOC131410567 isoform X3 n=1 Tax=Diceros bicornis minor TaxID=77932 RepID=UPI0026F18501|nr:uncharacterized protein LOC131410567 isoform X3 [Diceros bicornis minor]
MMPQKPSQSPFTLQLMSPRSQLQKMCRVNTATPTPGPSAGSSCQRWGLRTPRLAALLLLLLPGEQEHVCHLQEQVEKDSELKRGSCRQPGAHAEGGAGRAEGRGSLTEQPAAPSRVWRQQWDPKETPDGFEDEKQSLVPAKPLSSPSFSLFLRAVGVRDPEELLLVLHCQLCSTENLHKPPEEHTGEVSRQDPAAPSIFTTSPRGCTLPAPGMCVAEDSHGPGGKTGCSSSDEETGSRRPGHKPKLTPRVRVGAGLVLESQDLGGWNDIGTS